MIMGQVVSKLKKKHQLIFALLTTKLDITHQWQWQMLKIKVSIVKVFTIETYLSVFCIADWVGLSVLDSDGGHSEVTHSFLRQLVDTKTIIMEISQIWLRRYKNNNFYGLARQSNNMIWQWRSQSPLKQRCWRIACQLFLRSSFVWDGDQTTLWPPSHQAHSLGPSKVSTRIVTSDWQLNLQNFNFIHLGTLACHSPEAHSSCHFSFWRGP